MGFLDNTGLERLWTHICAQLGTKADASQVVMQATASSSDGVAYTVTVDNITALTAGVKFLMVPNKLSASTAPTLNVNGLGAKTMRVRLSNSTATTQPPAAQNWLAANKPVEVMYDGTYWLVDMQRPNMVDAYGTLKVANGGTGASAAGTTLLANIGITSGTDEPPASGTAGTIYIQYTA